MSVPLFIVGTGRCGSTMLSNLLKLHPKVLSISEFFSFVTDLGSLVDEAFPEGNVSAEHFWNILDTCYAKQNLMIRHDIAMQEVLYPYKSPTARFQAKSGVPAISQVTLPFLTPKHDELYDQVRDFVLSLSPDRIGAQYQKLFQWMAHTFNCVLWVERSGGSLRIVEQLVTHFPDARFIHLIRDGRNCAISMSRHYGFRMVMIAFALTGMLSIDPFENTDRSEIDDVTDEYYPFLPEHFDAEAFRQFYKTPSFYARYWSSELRNNLSLLQAMPDDRVLTMRFENFLQQPTESCRQLISFLDPHLADENWISQASAQIKNPTSSISHLSDHELELLTQACYPGMQTLMAAYPELWP